MVCRRSRQGFDACEHAVANTNRDRVFVFRIEDHADVWFWALAKIPNCWLANDVAICIGAHHVEDRDIGQCSATTQFFLVACQLTLIGQFCEQGFQAAPTITANLKMTCDIAL